MNYDSIPQYIKNNASFCCWKYETRKKNKTKVPYDAVTARKAQVDNPDTFHSFAVVVKAAQSYDGIGIRVAGHLIGIDLDYCIKNEQLLPWAAEIVRHFNKTYIEKSPSGTGLRILALISDGYTYDKNTFYIKKGNVEVYVSGATNRFVTVTGDVFQNLDVCEESQALQWLLDTHMKRKQTLNTAESVAQRDSYLSDESVLCKANSAKNAEKFKKLWNGDITDYPSQSEADVALCSMLAFYCNGNTRQIDRLFRQSSLMRDKWNSNRGENTYGSITIQKAVSNINNFYTPIVKNTAFEDFTEGTQTLATLDPVSNSRYAWSEIGAGRLFADFFNTTLCYVPERRMWFCYEDGIWNADIGSLKTMKCCMQLADLLYLYALKIKDEHKRKSYIDYTKRWQSHSYRVNVLKDAQVHHPISVADFDANPYIFNCSNGTLHMDTGEFTTHCSKDKLTRISKVRYDPSVTCKRWTNFISEIMSGDTNRVKFLQKILGYALSGDTRHECMMILYGASTRNGKGTLCESVLKVFGNYGCTARPETIAIKNNNNSSQPSEDIARLAGVRFVNIAEPGKGLVLNTSQIKSMTGNDTLNARFLHENSFDFRPQFKLYINTNYLPVINDITIFTSGRVIIIPFERHFAEAEQDKGLKREFTKKEAQSAILNWLLEGYRLLRSEGLTFPQSIIDATSKYQHDSDKLTLFMEDCMEHNPNYEERTSAVYERYKGWCIENGHYAESMKNFKQSLSAVMEVKRKRPNSGGDKTTMVLGYRLISEFLRE